MEEKIIPQRKILKIKFNQARSQRQQSFKQQNGEQKSSKNLLANTACNSHGLSQSSKERAFLNNYEFVPSEKQGTKILGKGSYGAVQLIRNKKSKQLLALKQIAKSPITEQLVPSEIDILLDFDHPNILKVYDYYTDQSNYNIITEVCNGGNLFSAILTNGRQFSELDSCKIMYQLLSAINYAHGRQIVHRDIKPENILLDWDNKRDKFIVKLIDWGLAKKCTDYLTDQCGTILYLAPEVLHKKYDHREAKSILMLMLDKDPQQRWKASDLLGHKWFDLLQNPTNKLMCTQELQESMLRLKNFQFKRKFQEAILGYIASHLVSQEERINLAKAFRSIDRDNDGYLSREDLLSGYQRIWKQDNDCNVQAAVEKILQSTGGDKLDYSQFIVATMDKYHNMTKENLEIAFKLLDLNNLGYVTLDNIAQTLVQHNICVNKLAWEALTQNEQTDEQLNLGKFIDMISSYVNEAWSQSQPASF